MNVPEEQLQILVDNMQDMTGFSAYGGDGAVLELALERLPEEEQWALLFLMEQGTRLRAAVALGEGDVGQGARASVQIKQALATLRREFESVTDFFYR